MADVTKPADVDPRPKQLMDNFPVVTTEILHFVDWNLVVETFQPAYQRWGGRHQLTCEAAKLTCVDLVATIHESLLVLPVHAGATLEVEAPYPLTRKFEWQERFCKVAKQECVPAQNIKIVTIAKNDAIEPVAKA